ncbi:hypothetical protein [Parasporobacterium paucivorans]|uniref:Uncharacterized protein n=1 Tax=Parasporobacterium paucivorans DSM 15970 TaxID=1122934 RepID=A0A1M6CZG0_9FIRM|nr:hypothetical protein [Parasporobacterium paucivorans]SHI66455.1 hypothetical protein SAMN02745691_00632 [Parasporobacterium paucivorans DSM 15970]
MDFITESADIFENILTFDDYLQDPAKQDFAIGLITEGINFVAVKKEQGYSFYPSRFIGYKNNSYDAHTKYNREARDTGPAISQILKHNPNPSQDLETEYMNFCKELGFTAKSKGAGGVERKFWITRIET